MKTLKTLLLETNLDVLRDRSPHISVNWNMLEYMDGSITCPKNGSNVILNLSKNSVPEYYFIGNILEFSCAFNRVQSQCIIPTVAIEALFDQKEGFVISFDITKDYQVELDEIEKSKQKKSVNHLRVIK